MKQFLCFGFLVSLAVATSAINSPLSEIGKYSRQVFRKSLKEICPEKETEFVKAVFSVANCSSLIDFHSETICSGFQKNFLKCSKPFIDVTHSCLSAEDNELVTLAFEIVQSSFSYICHTDGEHILELSNPCIKKGMLTKDETTRKCQLRLQSKVREYEDELPSRSSLCEFAESMKICVLRSVRSGCGNEITRDAVIGFIDAALSPCGNANFIKNANDVELF